MDGTTSIPIPHDRLERNSVCPAEREEDGPVFESAKKEKSEWDDSASMSKQDRGLEA